MQLKLVFEEEGKQKSIVETWYFRLQGWQPIQIVELDVSAPTLFFVLPSSPHHITSYVCVRSARPINKGSCKVVRGTIRFRRTTQAVDVELR